MNPDLVTKFTTHVRDMHSRAPKPEDTLNNWIESSIARMVDAVPSDDPEAIDAMVPPHIHALADALFAMKEFSGFDDHCEQRPFADANNNRHAPDETQVGIPVAAIGR